MPPVEELQKYKKGGNGLEGCLGGGYVMWAMSTCSQLPLFFLNQPSPHPARVYFLNERGLYRSLCFSEDISLETIPQSEDTRKQKKQRVITGHAVTIEPSQEQNPWLK